MYSGRYVSSRDTPQPPYLLIQQNRCQTLNTHAQQVYSSPINEQMRSMTSNNQGANSQFQRMVLQSQKIYSTFPKPSRSTISNHPSGFRTISQRRLLHHKQMLESNCNMFVNQFELNNNTPAARGGIYNDNIQPGLTVAEFEQLTQQNINENSCARTCNNALYRHVMNERMKSTGNNQLSDRSINPDNISPLLSLGEFERLTQQNINENVPAETCNNTLLYRGVMNKRMKSVVTNQLSDRSINTRTRTVDIINNNLNHNYTNVSSLDDHTYSRQNPENLSCKDENRFLPAFCTNCQNTSSYQPFGIPERQSCLLGTTQDLKSSKSCTCISKPKKRKKRKRKSAEDPSLLQSALKDVTNNETAVNEDKKAKIHPLCDRSINTRTDNIKPLLTLGEFERLTQQNINENVPAQTCNNTLLYRSVMNERMKSVVTNQLSDRSINTRTRTMDIINNNLNHNYANVSSLDDHTYSHQNPENLSCKDENRFLPAFCTNCQNTSSYQPFGIPERQSCLLGTTQNLKSSKSCTCISKPKKRKKKSAEDPNLLQSALKDVTNNETADNEDKNAKIHPPKQQTVKPFFQSSCVNGQDTVVTCSEQNAKLDYLALQQCQKDTNSFQCSTAKTKMNLLYPCSEKSSCNNEANAIVQNERFLLDSKNVGCKSILKKMQIVNSEYPPKSQNCNCENQKESLNILDQRNVEEQTGSLNKEESSERLKFAHMLVNILKIMLNGRKKKTNKNKNKWSENFKTDPKCSPDNNISMENGTTIQDWGHSAQLSKSTEKFSMSTLYKENVNDELNDSTERTKVEEGKIKGHSHQTRIEQTTVSSNLKSNDGNILQCVFESKNNLKLYGQDGNQDSEDTNQFVTKQRENECIINIDHTFVKKFEKRGPAEVEHKIKGYAANNLKPLDFDLDLQYIDKGDNYRKEIDAMRMNMNNQKVNSLNKNVNSEEQENHEKVNSLNNNVYSEEQENTEKINSLNSNVNSEKQENNVKVNSLNSNVNSVEPENNEKVNSLNNDVNSDEQENNEKVNSLNNDVNSDEQENNEKVNSLNNNVNSDEQENNEKVNSLNNDVNSDEQENNEKVNSLNNDVNSDEQENNEKVNSLNNDVNSDEQENNEKVNSLNNDVNSDEPENNEKVNSLNNDVNSDEPENNEKVNSLNNNVNNDEQEINEKVNSLNNNVNSEEQENNEKVNSLNSNVNSMEPENNEKVNSLNIDVNSDEQENNEKVNSLNNDVNSDEQENNEKVNSLNNDVNSDEQKNNEKVNSLNNNVNSDEQENNEKVNSLNNDVNSDEQENNEKVNSLNNDVNSDEQENNEKVNSLNNDVNSDEQENNEKVNSLNNDVNSDEQENNEKVNSLNNDVNSDEQENNEKVNSLNNDVNSDEQENNEKVNSLNNNVNSDEQENNEKVNSLNNDVNSDEQENNEKVNSLNNDVNSDEQENNEKINSLNNNVNSDEQENNEKVNSLNNNVNSDEQENNEKVNSLNNDVNSDEQENNEKVNSLNNDVNSDEQENNEKINSLNNDVNSDEQENNEKVNSLNNNVNSDEQENNEKVNSLNNDVNSDEQENNEKVNSLNNNVNSDEQENNDIIRWDQECDTCRTPYSQLSAKGKTTGNNDFSFLELGYCPIVLPLGCHEYEEDVNNNDSLETSVNDEDCVFRNKLMVKLCDEKYNHDKTEVLRPWIIQYLDEIPKPTVWKDFLENMDVENGAILDECDEHVFVDAIASPDVDEENCQTEVTCLWNEKIESLSNTPPENVNVSPKSQMDKDTNLYKTRKTSENLLLQETTSVKKMNSCSLSKGKLEKKENYVGPTETANDNVNTGKSTGIVDVNVLPSECTENNDDLFIPNDTTENYDHEETGRHIDNNLMKIKTTKKVNENDLNLPEVENKQIEKVRTNERKRGKKQSTDCKLIEEAMQLDGNEVRQSDENHLPKMMTSLHEVETNGQAARKSDISQKESEALTGLLILRNGHVCDSRNDMSNRNGYDFYCVSDISGIHGNTCDSRNDKSVWSKQEWPRIDDMSDENRNNYDSRNCSVIEISEDKTFEAQTTYTCTISDINLSNTQTTCSSEKEIDVNFSATQFSEDVFDEPIRSTQKEPEMGIFSLNKGDQELNSYTQTVNVCGERNDSNTLYTVSMSNRTISRANNTDTENVCPIKPPFSSMEIDVAEPIIFNDITRSQNKNKSGQKRNFEDVEKHIKNMLQEVRKKCCFDNLVKNQQQNASSVMAHVTVRENPVTNTSFIQTPLAKENPATNTFVQTPLVEENSVTNASYVQTALVEENPVTNASFVQTSLVEESSVTNASYVQTALVEENPVTNASFVQTPMVEENSVTNTFVQTPLVEENSVTNASFVQTPLVEENSKSDGVIQDQNTTSCLSAEDDDDDDTTPTVEKPRQAENISGKWLIPILERFNIEILKATVFVTNLPEKLYSRHQDTCRLNAVSETNYVDAYTGKQNIADNAVVQDCRSVVNNDIISSAVKKLRKRMRLKLSPSTRETNKKNESSNPGSYISAPITRSKAAQMSKQSNKSPIGEKKSDSCSSKVKFISNKKKRLCRRKQKFGKEANEPKEKICNTNNEHDINDGDQTNLDKSKTLKMTKSKAKAKNDTETMATRKTVKRKLVFDKETDEFENDIIKKRSRSMKITKDANEIVQCKQTAKGKLHSDETDEAKVKIQDNNVIISKLETDSEEQWNPVNRKRKKKINSKTNAEAIIETIPSEQSESNLNKKGKKKTRPRIEKNSKQIMKPAIIETIPSEQSESNFNKKGKKKTRPRIEKNSKQIMKTRTKSGKKKLEPKIKALKKLSELNMAKSKPLNDGKVTFCLVTESAEQKILKLKAEALRKFHAVKTCRYCHMTVPRRKYTYHVKVHHPYTCAKCSLLFSTKEEKLSHGREKHLTEIYHCITCDNVFYMKWCYEKHVTSSRHRNVREMYRRAVDMMRSCLGLSVNTASQGLKMLTDGHNSTTDDSTNSHDAVIHKGQANSLLLNTEDVSFSKHDLEVQKLLKDLSGIKSHMLSCNAANVSFPMIDMEKNQSAFYNYNTVSELMSQNYASIYTSDNTQFNDLNLDALVVNSDNFPMITQNSLNSSSENCQFMSCINSVAMETYSSSSSTLDLDESCFRECFENSDDQSELNMVGFSQTAAECNNSPTKGLISEVFHLLETDGFFDCGQFKSLNVERNVDLSNIDISKEFGQNKQSTDLWKDLNNVCNESTVNYSLLDISQKATTSDINTFPQEGNRYFNFDNMQGRPNISSRLALANINLASENCRAQNLVAENCCSQNLVSENCCSQNLVSENCRAQNIVPENCRAQNLVAENCCSQNLVSENCCSQNLVSENCRAQNIVPENCLAQNLVSENCRAQNIVSENYRSRNLVSENCRSQNLVSENCRSQNIISENCRSQNLVSENCLAQSIASDTKDSESTHLQYHVTQMENRLVVEAEFNSILQDIAETETACL